MTDHSHEVFRLHPGGTLEIPYIDDASGKAEVRLTNAPRLTVEEGGPDGEDSSVFLHVEFLPKSNHEGSLELEDYWGNPVLVLGGAFWELSRNDADGVKITTRHGCEQVKLGCAVRCDEHHMTPSTVDYTHANHWLRILLIGISTQDGTIEMAVEWPESVEAVPSWSGDLVTALGDGTAPYKG